MSVYVRYLVIDGGTPFKGLFVAMYNVVHLRYDVAIKYNYEAMSWEGFYRVLYRASTIASTGRATVGVF